MNANPPSSPRLGADREDAVRVEEVPDSPRVAAVTDTTRGRMFDRMGRLIGKPSKHRMEALRLTPAGLVRSGIEWNATQTPPWIKKATSRRRNKVARASRKLNRA